MPLKKGCGKKDVSKDGSVMKNDLSIAAKQLMRDMLETLPSIERPKARQMKGIKHFLKGEHCD